MKRKHLAQTCIVAALTLFAVVFSIWMKPLNSFDTQKISKAEKICYHVPASSTVYLAEVKPRISGCGGTSNATIFTISPALCLERSKARLPDFHEHALVSRAPIWLLHRSLLI